MQVVVQITSWTASDAYLTNPSLLEPAISSFSKADGCICVYSGLSEEDETTIYLFIVWEISEPPKILVDSPAYLRNTGLLSCIKYDAFQTNHTVHFNNNVIPALTAPITEVTLLTLKEGKTKGHLNQILNSVSTNPEIADNKYGALTWGDVEGTPDKFYLLFGWENAKVLIDTLFL
ncbi:hypothetical protein CVT25_010725 [Psilocybe cyanescens]|uniref:ABM domain-containing protein n=1 Tax=Psilocybe cyanescens TaxID=93625 RepID=A0A409WJQ4_PSICY|nr:hypothetical protein CVT25_010725 [Psilocybe cyanescens]